ncbi:hypothetical protein HDV00_010191 [Rhizophlyctis rosea]|nr:hypothetical protein HDV00_010191 [Rhizophlyctis rosea]
MDALDALDETFFLCAQILKAILNVFGLGDEAEIDNALTNASSNPVTTTGSLIDSIFQSHVTDGLAYADAIAAVRQRIQTSNNIDISVIAEENRCLLTEAASLAACVETTIENILQSHADMSSQQSVLTDQLQSSMRRDGEGGERAVEEHLEREGVEREGVGRDCVNGVEGEGAGEEGVQRNVGKVEGLLKSFEEVEFLDQILGIETVQRDGVGGEEVERGEGEKEVDVAAALAQGADCLTWEGDGDDGQLNVLNDEKFWREIGFDLATTDPAEVEKKPRTPPPRSSSPALTHPPQRHMTQRRHSCLRIRTFQPIHRRTVLEIPTTTITIINSSNVKHHILA